MLIDHFLAPRACLLAPLADHALAADLLSAAADAILTGSLDQAADFARQADIPALFAFGCRLMGKADREIHRVRPRPSAGISREKSVTRMPGARETRALFERDGWHCRFCGCRVISPLARSAMRKCLPGAIPWSEAEGYHGGFYALSASVDHVLPHSAGGGNELPNLVTACSPCQFGRSAWRIEEVGLMDPRDRAPVTNRWDGLCRVLGSIASGVSDATAVSGATLDASPRVSVFAGAESVPSADQARWLETLDRQQTPSSGPILAFLRDCAPLGVSWSLNKVLLGRMTVGAGAINFMGILPDGEIYFPWSIGDRKDVFKVFAETLAEGIPGAVCYETPKLWNVSFAGKTKLRVADLLSSLPALKLAIEALHAEMASTVHTAGQSFSPERKATG